MGEKENRRYSYMEKFLLLALLEGDLTQVEAYKRLRSLLLHFGIWQRLRRERIVGQMEKVDRAFLNLVEKGVVTESEGVCHLTDVGRTDASRLRRKVIRLALKLDDFLSNGETASKFSILVNALFAASKLVVGFLSNSMGLLSDGMDDLITTFASVTTFFGVKYKKEIYSTAFILGLMFFTSITLGYEAVVRFVHPEVIRVGFWAIFVAVISGVIYYLMSLYQHLVGRKYESLTIISQAIHNRDHAISAAAVLIGLICARFGVVAVDSVVSLVVAGLIFKSAIELSLETFSAARGTKTEFSKFKADYEAKLGQYQREYFKTWTLSQLKDFRSREHVVSEFQRAFSLTGVPIVHEFDLSLSKRFEYESHLDGFLAELVAEGFVVEQQGRFAITRSGERELNRESKPKRQRLAGLTRGNRFELKVDSKLENLTIISDFVSEAMKQFGIDLAIIFKVQIAVDEACANIIENGYTREGGGPISISCRKPRNDLVITIRDRGRPFDLDSILSSSLEVDFDEQKLGGLGIYLIRKLMDEVSYSSNPKKGNELTMTKYLPQAGENI